MKTQTIIKAEIRRIKKDYASVLTGSFATVQINAPRALQQLTAESRLHALCWVLEIEYKSKLKGIDR